MVERTKNVTSLKRGAAEQQRAALNANGTWITLSSVGGTECDRGLALAHCVAATGATWHGGELDNREGEQKMFVAVEPGGTAKHR